MNPNIDLGFPSLEEYYLMLAVVAGSRANCLNRFVGAILVSPDNGSILSTGYNGVPKGLPHCQTCRRRDEGFGPGEGLHRSRAVHAEANTLIQSAKYGNSTENSIMYITDMPCSDCCKLIINAGVKKVVYCRTYPGSEAVDLLTEANIEIKQIEFDKIVKKIDLFIGAIKSNVNK